MLADQAYLLRHETLPKDSSKVAHFRSMKISQEVREYAKDKGVSDEQALQSGMDSMSEEFKKAGGGNLHPHQQSGLTTGGGGVKQAPLHAKIRHARSHRYRNA